MTDVVIHQEKAHRLLWSEQTQNIGYFVYGTIKSLSRREKVVYINFEEVNEISFRLVVFDKYFKHFTYTDEELNQCNVLVYGKLRKNEYNGYTKTEMVIKSNAYIEKMS